MIPETHILQPAVPEQIYAIPYFTGHIKIQKEL